MRESLRAIGAAHHLAEAQWWIAGVAAWIVAGLSNCVLIPAMYPFQDPRTFVATAALAGLVLPVAVCCVVLDEGPPALVASAGRRLAPSRTGWAVGYVAGMTAIAWVASQVVPVAPGLFTVDALLLAGATALGIGVVGLRGGWLVPAVLVGICSTPGLVPWEWNWIYRTEMEGRILVVGLAATVIGAATFAAGGSRGLLSPASRLGTHAQSDVWA